MFVGSSDEEEDDEEAVVVCEYDVEVINVVVTIISSFPFVVELVAVNEDVGIWEQSVDVTGSCGCGCGGGGGLFHILVVIVSVRVMGLQELIGSAWSGGWGWGGEQQQQFPLLFSFWGANIVTTMFLISITVSSEIESVVVIVCWSVERICFCKWDRPWYVFEEKSHSVNVCVMGDVWVDFKWYEDEFVVDACDVL